MASNQMPVAEKARLISETFTVPQMDIERLGRKEIENCTTLEAYIKEGNSHIPFEMVREIQKKEVADCSTLELKIRYNDENLGKLPDWFDYSLIDDIIWKAVNFSWTGQLEPNYSREDIHSACWEHLLLKSKEITKVGEQDYIKFSKHLIKWHISNFYCYNKKHSKYINFNMEIPSDDEYSCYTGRDGVNRLPEVFYNLNESDEEIRKSTKSVFYLDTTKTVKSAQVENKILDTLEEEMDMLNTIKSISDITTRDLLSITAYILAGLDSFKGLYQEAVSRMTSDRRTKFLEIIEGKGGKKADFKKILKLFVGKESGTYLEQISDCLQKMMINPGLLTEV